MKSGLFSTIAILGSRPAGVGAMLCSYGRTSKYRCGPLLAVNEDMPIPLRDEVDDRGTPTIIGLNTARFCSIGGDSGGPVFTPDGQAQGTQVSTTCTGVGFTSTFQPINQTMLDLQVRLKPVGTRPVVPPLNITSFACESFGNDEDATFTCELNWAGGIDPDHVRISSNGRWIRRIDEYDLNHLLLAGDCAKVSATYISVSVFDADGRRADASEPSVCSLG